MKPSNLFVVVSLCALTTLAARGAADGGELVVHEWGTITTVHEADGTPVTGLNRIDAADVLPDFVHRFEPEPTRDKPKLTLGKSPLVPGRPDVNMRLETPVIYFHPPAGKSFDQSFDIKVRFHGGVLNEFYPAAEPSVQVDMQRLRDKSAAGAPVRWNGDLLNNYVVGQLEWKGLRLHDTVVAPLTNNPIWVAPREVQSASVFLPSAGEGERYVFYRGVAHLAALLQTELRAGQVQLRSPKELTWLHGPSSTISNVWLADVRADGAVAFREHGAVTLDGQKTGATLGAIKRFSASDYSDAGAGKLRGSLRKALIANGLFADEAEAMLNTWKASYFEKAGLRVFYVVPRDWVDYFLPLDISVPARVNRVIIGRIDFAR
jgi:hypothetical protein